MTWTWKWLCAPNQCMKLAEIINLDMSFVCAVGRRHRKGAQTIHERVGGKKDRGVCMRTHTHTHARISEKPKIQKMNKNIYKK